MQEKQVRHVCMLIYNYWPEQVGGAENQCRKLAKYFTKKGIKCSIVAAKTTRDSKMRQLDGSNEVIRIPVLQMLLNSKTLQSHASTPTLGLSNNKPNVSANIVKWLNTLLFMFGAFIYFYRRRKDIDIIHVHIADWIAGYAGLVGHIFKIPVICKGAFIPVFPKFGKEVPFFKTIDKWRRKIAYFALTEDMMKDLALNDVPKERIAIVPNLVEIPRECSDVEKNRYALYIGNLSQPIWHKAFDVLFNAWCLVHSKEPKAKLVVAGAGVPDLWKNFLYEKNAEKSVDFVGFISDLGPLFKNATLFVLPSRSEGISNALLEAQSWGIPAIATNIPGNKAVIVDQVTGILTAVDDAQAFAEAILIVLRDPIKRKTMGVAARKRMEKIFSPHQVFTRIIHTYHHLLSNENLN